MKRSTYVLIIILIFIVLIAAAAASLVFMEFGREPAVRSHSRLEIRLQGEINELVYPDWTSLFFGAGPRLSMHELWMNLRKARADRRIDTVVLRLGPMICDWGKINELRDLVSDLRSGGKKVYAYIEEALEFDKEYFLATACDRIVLHPEGFLIINGIGGSTPFLQQTLDKLGIEAEVEHEEEYKTAYHMFLHDGFTPEHREMMESLYGSLFDRYVEGVAETRGKSREEIAELIDKGFFSAEEARKAGLIDDVLYEDQLQDMLKREHGNLTRISHSRYLRTAPPASLGLNRGRKIALIYGMGPILTGEGFISFMGSGSTARMIREARKDASISAIVFRVDSPGGSVVASDTIWREINLAKKEKPVVVSMSDMAGSGGYQVAMAAHKIVAQPQTLTGSIGVIFAKFNFSGLYEKLGIKSETVRRGKHADMFSSFRSLTSEERELLHRNILDTYRRFVAKAAEGRNMPEEEILRVAGGRVWTGEQARELGLIDELGGLSRAIELARELAGIPERDPIRLVVRPRAPSFWDTLFAPKLPQLRADLPPRLRSILQTLRILEPQQPWALMPFWLNTD